MAYRFTISANMALNLLALTRHLRGQLPSCWARKYRSVARQLKILEKDLVRRLRHCGVFCHRDKHLRLSEENRVEFSPVLLLGLVNASRLLRGRVKPGASPSTLPTEFLEFLTIFSAAKDYSLEQQASLSV